MSFNPEKHHRRSIRLKNYDYSRAGAYFVTLATNNREYLFGRVIDGKMLLNNLGEIVKDEWLNTPKIRPNITIDNFIIMPNHLHGIVIIGEDFDNSIKITQPNSFQTVSKTLGAIIRGFKAAVTKQINIIRQTPHQSVWQRNYYERIVRNDEELQRIRNYIDNNPLNWGNDENNLLSLSQV